MKNTLLGLAMAAFVAVGLAPAPALADDADEAIKYRKYNMGTVGDHMQSFVAILQGKVPHQDQMAYHARALADAAARSKVAFAANTAGKGKEPTTSKDSI